MLRRLVNVKWQTPQHMVMGMVAGGTSGFLGGIHLISQNPLSDMSLPGKIFGALVYMQLGIVGGTCSGGLLAGYHRLVLPVVIVSCLSTLMAKRK